MDDSLRSERTRVFRVPERARYDRDTVHAILDEGLVASVGVCQGDQPFVIPMAYARRGDQLLLHGARASRTLRLGADGIPVCVTVTLLDGIVLARSAFHHSLNYRSAVIVGRAQEITAREEKLDALQAIVDHYLPGRSAEVRPPDAKELAATCVLALPIREASAKLRSGGPLDEERDLSLTCWAGHLPLALVPSGPPVADGAQPPPPEAVRDYRRGRAPARTA
jgi:uncharacterized protein